jgi:hypothetical protein
MALNDIVQPMPNGDRNDPKVGVDFIDIIFGIAVGVVFTRFSTTTRHQYQSWGYLVVALALIGFSWIGYHKSKTANPKNLKFTDPTGIAQFFVDIAIVALYFAIATETNVRFPVESALIAVVFGLYALWDALDIVQHVPNAGIRLRNSLLWMAGFGVAALVVERPWRIQNKWGILVLDGLTVVALYLYRVAQERNL